MLRQVTVKNGRVEGLPASDPCVTAFKGIPYAAPPVGQNRWRAPQPAADWSGVLKAYDFGPGCMQRDTGKPHLAIYKKEWGMDPDTPMSEDSLTLNVWTPAKSPEEKLPVFLWFYGGGYTTGMSCEKELDGERLARRGIVVVSANYRVNVFGFLAHPELTAEAPDAPTNFGFLDQRLANLWVKENIAAFGGDPDNITIGGQSAGGGSVLSQLTSPLTKGLFQRAIVLSGVSQMAYLTPALRSVTLAQAEQRGVEFFDALGVKTLEEARALDADYICDVYFQKGLFFMPPIDGVFQVGHHHELFMNGQCDVKPILLGRTGDEFPAAPAVKTPEELRSFAADYFGDDAPEFLRLVDAEHGTMDEILSRARFPSFEYTIRLFGEMKRLTGEKTPMYCYVFDPEMPGDDAGTFHSSDLWFWFETLAKCWRPFTGKHYDLARQMCNYWANFIRSGDPNGPDADGREMPRWAPYTADTPCRMLLGDTVRPDDTPPGELLAFMLKREIGRRRTAMQR